MIFTALMSLFGVWLGSYLTSNAQNDLWQKQAEDKTVQKIIDKRFELIEKTAKLIGQAPGIDDLWKLYTKNNYLDENGEFVYILTEKDKDLSEKLGNYQGEYKTLFMLDGCLFGPKTGKALTKLNEDEKPFWQKSTSTMDNIITAMISELNYQTTGTLGHEFCNIQL